MRYKHTKEELEKVIKTSLSIADVCRKLGIRPVGGNYKTLNFKIKEWNLDISHFTGRGWNTGLKFRPNKSIDLKSILVENSSFRSSNKLRIRLIKEGLKERKCEICKREEWNSKIIPLELDHINGINTDNRIENLRIICPNCHAQTSNYRGRNKLSAQSEKIEVEYSKFRETLTSKVDGNPEPSLNNKEGAET